MLTNYYYKVAGLVFCVSLPEGKDADRLLPSFRPFRCEPDAVRKDNPVFRYSVKSDSCPDNPDLLIIDEAVNDMGYTRLMRAVDFYRVEIRFTPDAPSHLMDVDSSFVIAVARVDWTDPYVGNVISSQLRIVFSQAILRNNGISLHAAAVSLNGKAYLFMGKSGTGKSTHAALWHANIAGVELLNDDNPALRIENGRLIAYGTPWSGKTPCYKNLRYPVGGMARLVQSYKNRFLRRKYVPAFVTLLPGCSVIREDAELYRMLCDTLIRMTELARIGVMECRPDDEAVAVCARGLCRLGTYKFLEPKN